MIDTQSRGTFQLHLKSFCRSNCDSVIGHASQIIKYIGTVEFI